MFERRWFLKERKLKEKIVGYGKIRILKMGHIRRKAENEGGDLQKKKK
jgi:hypothetical protein